MTSNLKLARLAALEASLAPAVAVPQQRTLLPPPPTRQPRQQQTQQQQQQPSLYAPLPPDVFRGPPGVPQLRARAADAVASRLEALLRSAAGVGGDANAAKALVDAKLRNKHFLLDDVANPPPRAGGGRGAGGGAAARPSPRVSRAAAAARRAARRARGKDPLPRGEPGSAPPFHQYAALHDHWCQYAERVMSSAAASASPEAAASTIDLHGAHLTVLRSASPGFTGLSGVAIRIGSKFVLLAAGRCGAKRALRSVPCAGSVFGFAVCGWEARISGEDVAAAHALGAAASGRGGGGGKGGKGKAAPGRGAREVPSEWIT